MLHRPESYAKINTETVKTFRHVLNNRLIKKLKYDYILDMSYNTPYLSERNIETAINIHKFLNRQLIQLYKKHMYFKHDGNGLKSIVRNSNLKLERCNIQTNLCFNSKEASF